MEGTLAIRSQHFLPNDQDCRGEAFLRGLEDSASHRRDSGLPPRRPWAQAALGALQAGRRAKLGVGGQRHGPVLPRMSVR